MGTNTKNEELYKVVLYSLKGKTNNPDEIATALARALIVTLRATQDLTGDKEGVKEAARKTFADIVNML